MEAVPLLGVVGPTATGKTELSLRLAEALDAEIVSVDSMVVYRGMDIGTAKPIAGRARAGAAPSAGPRGPLRAVQRGRVPGRRAEQR